MNQAPSVQYIRSVKNLLRPAPASQPESKIPRAQELKGSAIKTISSPRSRIPHGTPVRRLVNTRQLVKSLDECTEDQRKENIEIRTTDLAAIEKTAQDLVSNIAHANNIAYSSIDLDSMTSINEYLKTSTDQDYYLKLVRLVLVVCEIQKSIQSGSCNVELWEKSYKLLLSNLVPPEIVETKRFLEVLGCFRAKVIVMKLFKDHGSHNVLREVVDLGTVSKRLAISKTASLELFNLSFKLKLSIKNAMAQCDSMEEPWNQVTGISDKYCFELIDRFAVDYARHLINIHQLVDESEVEDSELEDLEEKMKDLAESEPKSLTNQDIRQLVVELAQSAPSTATPKAPSNTGTPSPAATPSKPTLMPTPSKPTQKAATPSKRTLLPAPSKPTIMPTPSRTMAASTPTQANSTTPTQTQSTQAKTTPPKKDATPTQPKQPTPSKEASSTKATPSKPKRRTSNCPSSQSSEADQLATSASEPMTVHECASAVLGKFEISKETRAAMIELFNREMQTRTVKKPKKSPKKTDEALKFAVRGKNPWTESEFNALEQGMAELGRKWAAILSLYGPLGSRGTQLKNRSQKDLKDKARNEKLRREKFNLPLGPFE